MSEPQQPAPQPGQQPPPYAYPYVPPPPTSSKASAALVLGILGLVMCGPFTAIPAIFVGRSATREIDASQGRLGGRGTATAGYVLGIIGAILTAIVFIAVIGLFVLGATLGSMFDTKCTTTDTGSSFSIHCD